VGAVLGFGPSVRGMLGPPKCVGLEPVEGLVDISRHGNVNVFAVIIPVDCHGKV
jgi:hypothetical protein